MNEFGVKYRIGIFGSSHGLCIGAKVEGCPPGSKSSKKMLPASATASSASVLMAMPNALLTTTE